MSGGDDGRAAGPWGGADSAPAAPQRPRAPRYGPDQGQHPAWALASSLLTAAFIWWFSGSVIVAVAIVGAIFVHEFGHVLAMNRLGQGPARITIIPFFGGAAHPARGPASEWNDVLVSLAGPVFGLLATLPLFAGFYLFGAQDWLVAAFLVAMLNLVNLAPAPPLDGSRALGPVLGRIHPAVEKGALLIAAGAGAAWGLANGFYFIAIFLVLALFGQLKRGSWRPEARPLTGVESGASLGLFLGAMALCLGVAVIALLPLTGSIEGALVGGGRYLGVIR